MRSLHRSVRHAEALEGIVAELAERLQDALESNARQAGRGARIELGIEITALRHRLAELFAERHGWRHSRAIFTPSVLARRGVWDGHSRGLNGWPYRLIDHPYFFRTADRRAAALAAHLYDATPPAREEMRLWVARHRLRVAFPADFPSWWVPGGTTLCLYLPAEQELMPGGA